jgi:N-acetylmuramoyl-L-alanine amidase
MPPDAGSISELTTKSSKPNAEMDFNAAADAWTRYLAQSARHKQHTNELRTAARNGTGSSHLHESSRSQTHNRDRVQAKVEATSTATADAALLAARQRSIVNSSAFAAQPRISADASGSSARTKLNAGASGYSARTKLNTGASDYSARTKLNTGASDYSARTKLSADSSDYSARPKLSADSSSYSTRPKLSADTSGFAAQANLTPSITPKFERRYPTPSFEQPQPAVLSWLSGQSGELTGKRIVIDPGHGGWDCGAKYGGVCEKDITLDMAKLVADGLRRRGAEVIMTRDSDKAVELGARYSLTRQERPDAFLSIHCNASPRGEDESAYGIQTHFYAPKSAQYARAVSASLSNKLSESSMTVNNRGTFDRENSDFYVLKNQNIPSALVELGFVSNRKERNLLSDPEYRQRLADALINAEVSYLTQPVNTKPQLMFASNASERKSKGV